VDYVKQTKSLLEVVSFQVNAEPKSDSNFAELFHRPSDVDGEAKLTGSEERIRQMLTSSIKTNAAVAAFRIRPP